VSTPSFADLLAETLQAARAGRWAAHRRSFAVLREGLCDRLGPEEEGIRMRLDTLSAAAPVADPEGYLAELEQLARELGERGLPAGGVSARLATLDLRGLQPPEPMTRIFEALDRAPGEPLRAILPHEPVPLYAMLRERGYTCSGAPRADGGYEILVERA
jgi:hypothetical protein